MLLHDFGLGCVGRFHIIVAAVAGLLCVVVLSHNFASSGGIKGVPDWDSGIGG